MHRITISTYLSFLLVLLSGLHTLAAQTANHLDKSSPLSLASTSDYVEGYVMVKLKPEYKNVVRENAFSFPNWKKYQQELRVKTVKQRFPFAKPVPAQRSQENIPDITLIYALEYDTNALSIEAAIQLLRQEDAFEYVEPWYKYKPFYTPNDALVAGASPSIWYLNQIQAYNAWDIYKGDSTVAVGIADTGIYFSHEDMGSNVFYNLGEYVTPADTADGIDDDGNGLIDDYRGWDFYGDGAISDNNPTVHGSSHGHGVAGLAGARGDNALGALGTGFKCKYYPINISDNVGNIVYGYEGIAYAAALGIPVINCSWGGSNYDFTGEAVINNVIALYGTAIVVACGNSNLDEKFYPAAFDQVMSVGNTGLADVKSTCTYNTSLDICGTGYIVNIPSNATNGYFAGGSATSFASPVVAGAVALTYAYYHNSDPTYKPIQALHRVRMTADDVNAINPAFANKLGKGRLNMHRALTDPVTPAIHKTESKVLAETVVDNEYRAGETISLGVKWQNYLQNAGNVTITLSAMNPSDITLITSTYAAGAMNTFVSKDNYATPFQFTISPSLTTPHYRLGLKMTYSDPVTGYIDEEYMDIFINPNYLNLTQNLFHTTLTGTGNIGNYYADSMKVRGLTVKYNGNDTALYECGILIAKGTLLANSIRGGGSSFKDSTLITGGAGAFADYETSAIFSDKRMGNRIGLTITQKSYSYTDAANDDYIILEYSLHNENAYELQDVYMGMFADWDIRPDYSLNNANYDECRKMVYADNGAGQFYGIALLTSNNFRAKVVSGAASNFTSANKIAHLKNIPTPASASASNADVMQFISTGGINIRPNEESIITFVLMGANSLANLQATQLAAYNKYYNIIHPNVDHVDITVSKLDMSLGYQAEIGRYNMPSSPAGLGLQYDAQANVLQEGGFLLGQSATKVLNNMRNDVGGYSNDFGSTNFTDVPTPSVADYEAAFSFSDCVSSDKIGVSVVQNVYSFADAKEDDFLIMEYTVTNNTAVTQSALSAGLFMDWNIGTGANNYCNYNTTQKMVYAYDGLTPNYYYGIAIISTDAMRTRAVSTAATNFTEANKFTALTNVPTAGTASMSNTDVAQFISAAPFTLTTNTSRKIAFAIIGAKSLAGLDSARQVAIHAYYARIFSRVLLNTNTSVGTPSTQVNAPDGWTYAYRTSNTKPNEILLAYKKDAALTVPTANITVGTTTGYTQITAPTAPYANFAVNGWYVMNRFWNLTP
ncbi:MAG: S8 family serine peptidase, partial [Bacteroidia bacterium]